MSLSAEVRCDRMNKTPGTPFRRGLYEFVVTRVCHPAVFDCDDMIAQGRCLVNRRRFLFNILAGNREI